ncbi:MAG TPA: HDOD domain-containing protein [Pirellulales bacterium]|jgi:HD-like signal output (HDOD) protein/GGDEF domain-containing protein
MSDDQAALERFVDQAGTLYSLPTVAVEILKLTSQPKADLTALKNCLLRDPALVGKMLRVVNSSLFGLSREVADLNQALALLGTKSVRLLVLGFSIPDELFAGIAGDILQRYWHRTAIKATAARELSEAIFRQPGEEAFIAGLLQDVGILVLVQQLGEPYVRFLDRAFAKEVDAGDAEAVALGFNHVQLSAGLLRRWNLPESLVNPIAAGYSTERISALTGTQRVMAQILHLADLLAGMLTERRADWLGQLLGVGHRYRQVSPAQISSLVAGLEEKVDQLASVMSLELPRGESYQTVLEEAHRQLSLAADDAAVRLAAAQQGVVTNVADDEESVLQESSALAEAVRRFAQQPGVKAAMTTNSTGGSGSSASLGTTVRETTALKTAASTAIAPTATTAAASTALITTTAPTTAGAGPDSVMVWSRAGETASQAAMLLQSVAKSVVSCRQNRSPLSLILLEIDQYDKMLAKQELQKAQRISQLVGLVCGRQQHAQGSSIPVRDGCFAVLLPDCDRRQAVDHGQELLREVRRIGQPNSETAENRFSVSIGIATLPMTPKNFQPQTLIDSAARCLHAAQRSSGNTLKSIDVL